MLALARFLRGGCREQTWNSKVETLWLLATASNKRTILRSKSGVSSSGQITCTFVAPVSARRCWMANTQFFFFLLTNVGGVAMLGAGRLVPASSAPGTVSRIAVKSLLLLNAWAKHQSYRPWVPGTKSQGLSSLKSQNSRIEASNISAKGRCGSVSSKIKSSLQVSHGVFPRCYWTLSMSHPGVNNDGVIPGRKWILSMCHPGGTRGLLSLSSRHKTIKHNGMSTNIGIFVASHLVLASKTMLIAL